MKSFLVILLSIVIFAVGNLSAQFADQIVIGEIYGGGGNSGAIFRNDYVELYNPTSESIYISGWSVQYASATGATWTVNALGESASIAPHAFFLLRLASGGTNGDSLPTADAIGTSNLSATGGKIALVNNVTPLSGVKPVDSSVVDLVGYGSTASAFEGSGPAPGGNSTTSLERKAQNSSTSETMTVGGSDEFKGNGWDSNNNNTDIIQRAGPQPQNSISAPEYPPTENQPPVISSISRNPFIPIPGSADTVFATITDDGKIQNANLHVRINGEQYDSSLYLNILTGTIYYAVIPAGKHTTHGHLVEYFVSAIDDSSAYSSTRDEPCGYFVGESPIRTIKSYSVLDVVKYGARINGTINSNTNLFQPDAGFVQDSGGGLRVYAKGLPFLKEGRNTKIEGTIRISNGGFELGEPNFCIIDTSLGTSLVTPVLSELPLDQSASNAREGRVVEIQSLVTDSTGVYIEGKRYVFRNSTDDTLTIKVESNGSANTLAGRPISASQVNAVGVLAYNNTNLELKPRRAADMGMQEGDGTGTASIVPTSRLINAESVSETLTAVGNGINTLEGVSLSIPPEWSWSGSIHDAVLSGLGFSYAVKSLSGNGTEINPWLITITGSSITNTAVGTVIIKNLRTPSLPGMTVFRVKTRVLSGVLSEIGASPPVLISENTFEAIASGNWNSPSIWSGGVVPDGLDNVTITTPDIVVTIDGEASCANLVIKGVDTVGGHVGPLLQFDSTGFRVLTVNGRLELSGGAGGGGGGRGGRPKLTSNGNPGALLNIYGSIFTNVSNTVDRGSAGLNMNEGTVHLLGSTNDTLKNSAGLRLANLIIGDGIKQKHVTWVSTAAATLYIRSLLIKSGSEVICGGTTYATTNAIGNSSSSGLPMLTGGITLDRGSSLIVNNASGGHNSAAINLKDGGIINHGTLNLRSPDGSRSYSVCIGEFGADPTGSNQTIGGSSVGIYEYVQVGRLDTICLTRSMLVLDSLLLKGEIIESNGNTVVGTISILRKILQDEVNTCGGIGIIINALDASPDTTCIHRTTGIFQFGGGNRSILRYYDINSKHNTGLNATLICSYDSSELDGQDASSLLLWRSIDNGLSWHYAGGNVNIAERSVSITGIQSFSRWTISDTEHSLESSGQSYYLDPGWNMISVPLIVADYSKKGLYPTAASEAFLFNGLYEAQDTLCNGIGYWIKFSEKDTVHFTGAEYLSDTISLVEGWNMIGIPSRSISAAQIEEIPYGLIESQVFGYAGTYITADTLLPGKAYWLKANSAGQIKINAIPEVGYTAIRQDDEIPNLQSITVTDTRGLKQKIYFGFASRMEYLGPQYELPPVPPGDCFDVRFESNRYIELFEDTLVNGTGSVNILIQGASFPLTLEWNIRDGSVGSYSLKNTNGDIVDLSGNGKWIVTNGTKIKLIHTNVRERASDLYLSAAHPNPFNLTTGFTVKIPHSSNVDISVYDFLGKKVKTLFHGFISPGSHNFLWNGQTDENNEVSSGIYYLYLECEGTTKIEKIILAK